MGKKRAAENSGRHKKKPDNMPGHVKQNQF
jgi:hypothetical protein